MHLIAVKEWRNDTREVAVQPQVVTGHMRRDGRRCGCCRAAGAANQSRFGAILTWETDDGVIELVGVGLTLYGQVALVLLLVISVFGLAFVARRRRKSARR